MQATIHNEFLTLTVDTHGAEAVSLKNAAGGGPFCDTNGIRQGGVVSK